MTALPNYGASPGSGVILRFDNEKVKESVLLHILLFINKKRLVIVSDLRLLGLGGNITNLLLQDSTQRSCCQGISQKQCPIPCFELWEQYFLRKSDAAQEPHQGVPTEGSLADATSATSGSATSGITIAKRNIDVKAFGQ